MENKKKVAFYTLGCKLNFSETSTISRNFQNEGFNRVDFEEVADIYVINTCSVTDNADKQFKQIVRKALKNNEIKIDENLIIKIEDIENCTEPIEELIANQKPEAIFAVNELFAVTAIKAAKKLNIKVPEELAVIGFTDGIISTYSSPSITTVSQNGIKMGNKAAQMLIERLESEDEEEHYKTEVIETHLVQRESTPALK